MLSRKRLAPEESRQLALEAAAALLAEQGPQAVTLKAVAGRMGRTHANVLHHFGSAAELQKALSAHLGQQICASVASAVLARREGRATPRDLIDLAFDACEQQAAGQFACWMLLTGNQAALAPMIQQVVEFLQFFAPDEMASDNPKFLHRMTMTIVELALGDALVGGHMAEALGVERASSRAIIADMLGSLIAQRDAQGLRAN